MIYSAIKTFSTKLLHKLINWCVLWYEYIPQLILICFKPLKHARIVQTLNMYLTINKGVFALKVDYSVLFGEIIAVYSL
jgi:hypothetical protein